jgi:hypothetical protein
MPEQKRQLDAFGFYSLIAVLCGLKLFCEGRGYKDVY